MSGIRGGFEEREGRKKAAGAGGISECEEIHIETARRTRGWTQGLSKSDDEHAYLTTHASRPGECKNWEAGRVHLREAAWPIEQSFERQVRQEDVAGGAKRPMVETKAARDVSEGCIGASASGRISGDEHRQSRTGLSRRGVKCLRVDGRAGEDAAKSRSVRAPVHL